MSAEHRLEGALAALRRALDGMSVRWVVIGGIAVIARGVRRMTTDIDVVVRGDDASVPELVAALERCQIVPRIDNAIAFARQNLVLLARHQSSRVDIDLSLGWSRFEHEAIAASDNVVYGRVPVPMASAAALVVFKAIAARPRDLADVEALLLLHASLDLTWIRDQVAALAELADAPELREGLEAKIATARAATHRARRRRRTRARTKRRPK